MIRLRILLPQRVLLDRNVSKVIAEAANGSFCLLPRHIDFVAPLVSGVLFFETPKGEETFLAIDAGILVKKGADVFVSTPDAVVGPDLGSLRQTVVRRFIELQD
ncbi:F0F1 ATP synthase subunit epsilon [Chloroflexi bacterium TSY]|nr:F0F1 ATP synthase subunit epsilon [Chloroflexi bacterium TSY]